MSRFLSLVTYYAYMTTRDLYGHRLTTGQQPAASYNAGVAALLRLHDGALESVSQAVALDPTFALGHAALALLGHEFCAPVDVEQRLRAARLHAGRATERERSHVHAVDRHVRGDSAPLVAHLQAWPTDALLLSVAVPTIAFAGATTVPAEAWAIVERAAPAYGNDWWYAGLLAFMRQEQGRFDEAMDLARSSLAVEPAGGHAAHARAHAHYETGDHAAGLAWMDAWIDGDGQVVDKLEHFSWHAALHELSMGDLAAVALRYETQLAPRPALGCRALVDSGSLLWRWTLTPGVRDVPPVGDVLDVVHAADPNLLAAPKTAFMGMHAAVGLAAADDEPGLRVLGRPRSPLFRPGDPRGGRPARPCPAPARARPQLGGRRRPRPDRPGPVARRRQRRPARGRRGDADRRAPARRAVRRRPPPRRRPARPPPMSPRRVVSRRLHARRQRAGATDSCVKAGGDGKQARRVGASSTVYGQRWTGPLDEAPTRPLRRRQRRLDPLRRR